MGTTYRAREGVERPVRQWSPGPPGGRPPSSHSTPGNGMASVTAPGGFACQPEHGSSPQQLVDAADAALFEAKAAGKNRVRTAPSRSAPAPREVQ